MAWEKDQDDAKRKLEDDEESTQPNASTDEDEESSSKENHANDNIEDFSTQQTSPSTKSNSEEEKKEELHTSQDNTLENEPDNTPADFAVKVYDDSTKENTTNNTTVTETAITSRSTPSENQDQNRPRKRNHMKSQKGKRKRKGRSTRVASIDDSRLKVKGLPLPSDQYEAILIRRAIRKLETSVKEDSSAPSRTRSPSRGNYSPTPKRNGESSQKQSASFPEETEKMEIYGDTSLGMKLSVIAGKVIVQHLKSLDDGRASPAQLAGTIKRGDVLLSVNGKSLVNLPIDKLMSGLGPLSSPDISGAYRRKLKLRFAVGTGIDLLNASETNQFNRQSSTQNKQTEIGGDMLALFPMVDQLSGRPLFENDNEDNVPQSQIPSSETNEYVSKESKANNDSPLRRKPIPLNDLISQSLASFRIKDRERFLNEFHAWNNNFTGSTEDFSDIEMEAVSQDITITLTLPELIELGRKAIRGAFALSKQMEDVDNGKDLRSFQSWNTTLSLYSRASTRRKRVFDAASVPVNFGKLDENDEENNTDDGMISKSTNSSGTGEKVDGDELLLRLAAHDEIWRKQVIEFLNKISQDLDDPETTHEEDSSPGTPDIDAALSNELGGLLFGENMTKILAKHRRPRSLPSDEVTAVLFDLATKLSASIPDEIRATGDPMSVRSSLTPFTGMRKPPPGSDVLLATRFLLDEALPAWTKAFKPLGWEYRRVLWPLENGGQLGGSTAASSLSDELTLESFGTGRHTNASSRQRRKRKDIREMIEDQEIDPETRAETCFLVTFYFTQALLPRLMQHELSDNEMNAKALDEIIIFLGEYGSYLKLHTCIAYAAVLKAETVIDLLLGIAKHDPRHKEVMRQISKSNQLVFYEPTMLSAIVQRLYDIQKERSFERRTKLIEVCSAAYPDIRPWQVKKKCYDLSSKNDVAEKVLMEKLYYKYLSLLLHPTEGHDVARRNPKLVEEWCRLSIRDVKKGDTNNDRRSNFFCVASRASSTHLVYHRDLLLLLQLSMELKEHSLALDIVGELLDDQELSKQKETLQIVLSQIRCIGLYSLDSDSEMQSLKRILRLFSRELLRKATDVPAELLKFIEHLRDHSASDTIQPNTLRVVRFFAEQAVPGDFLKALALWPPSTRMSKEIFAVLHTVLERGTTDSRNCELSASRLRLKRARQNLSHPALTMSITSSDEEDEDEMSSHQSIWRSMANGTLSIAK